MAGGIGITPIHSTFRALSQLARREELPGSLREVKLIWSGRTPELFNVLVKSIMESLKDIPSTGPKFTAHLFMDNPAWPADESRDGHLAKIQVDDALAACFRVTAGRPSFNEICQQTVADASLGGTVLL